MSNPTAEERDAKTLAFLIICDLIITILMRGSNTRFDVPHIIYIVVAVVCGLVGLISYLGFLYIKIFKSAAPRHLPDIFKIIALGVMAYFTVSFSIGILVNL